MAQTEEMMVAVKHVHVLHHQAGEVQLHSDEGQAILLVHWLAEFTVGAKAQALKAAQ
jgi:hypothetical protein